MSALRLAEAERAAAELKNELGRIQAKLGRIRIRSLKLLPPSSTSSVAAATAAAAAAAADAGCIADEGGRVWNAAGVPLCYTMLNDAKCRYGKKCTFIHEVPVFLQARYAELRRAELLARLVANTKAERLTGGSPPHPSLRPAPDWIDELREERFLAYDVRKYPLAEAMADVLEASSSAGLSTLHTMELTRRIPTNPRLIHALRFAGIKLPTKWKRALQNEKQMISRMSQSEPYLRFMKIYRKFLEEVIAPQAGRSLRCQCPPTMRVVMPSYQPSIGPHTDSEFDNHVSAEINYWVPLTRVWGNNTLWVESKPGHKDFRPVECDYGQIFRFNGNRCTHFTTVNDTTATRVSFDFRAIPLSEYHFEFDGKIGDYNSETFVVPDPPGGK